VIIQNSFEFSRNPSVNYCPECGEVLEVHAAAYLMECDRCLSKRDE
jgi:Zn finger protein HypA/HybF involved in hydrogenase expression